MLHCNAIKGFAGRSYILHEIFLLQELFCSTFRYIVDQTLCVVVQCRLNTISDWPDVLYLKAHLYCTKGCADGPDDLEPDCHL